MPPLSARPRHAAPRDAARLRAALVPAVLLTATGSALGGLAVSASAGEPVPVYTAASTSSIVVPGENRLADRELVVEQLSARASRERDRRAAERLAAEAAAAQAAAAQAAAAEAAAASAEAARLEADRVATEAATAEVARLEAERVAAEAAAAAAAPKYARPGDGRLTSGFGSRWGRLHAGIDLAAGTGSPIRAAAAGTVVSARAESGYGNCVRIEHADGTETVYGHLSSFLVEAGEDVEAGQDVAREGNTGRSTGPHLHFEVRVDGTPVDPRRWLQERGVGV